MMIRRPIVAGSFYYFDKDNLTKQLDSLFLGVPKNPACKAVVSPHAGYTYSGKTAAYAISSLKPFKDFIILGPNHTGIGEEFSIMSSGKWQTPLGFCEINSEIAEKLKECKFLVEDRFAHVEEHSIEVQLPFLQYRFKHFQFVPICVMNASYSHEFMEKCRELGELIAKMIRYKDIGLIASSDFSHYLPRDVAKEKDDAAIKAIKNLSMEDFFDVLSNTNASICGFGPIAVVMAAAKRLKLKPKIIHKSDSGNVTGDVSNVVSYYAIGFE
jgi:hypothetical protein